MQTNNARWGFFDMLISCFFFSCLDVCVKITSEDYPIGEIVFFRMVFGLIPIAFYVPKDRWPKLFHTTKLKLHFIRGLLGMLALVSIFTALKFLELATVTTIALSSPIFATLMSIFILGEKVRLRRWAAILTGLIGVVIIVNPEQEFNLYLLLPIAFCFFFSMVAISVRALSQSEPVYIISLYFSLFGIIASLLTIFFSEWHLPNNWADFLILVFLGLAGGFGNTFLTSAYSKAEVSTVTPVKYTALLFAIMWGYFLFSEVPTMNVIFGAIVIITSTLFILGREKSLKKEIQQEKYSIQR
jgi:drug/metabolite transporter (DMT)-like permease